MSCKVQFVCFFVVEFRRLGHMFKWRKNVALVVVAYVKQLLFSQALKVASGVNDHSRRCLWLMYPLMMFYLMCDQQQKCSDVNVLTMLLWSMTRSCRLFWFCYQLSACLTDWGINEPNRCQPDWLTNGQTDGQGRCWPRDQQCRNH